MSKPRRRVRAAGVAALGLLVGAVLGVVGGLLTPAHLQIAGSDAAVRIHLGRDYDELDLSGLLTGELPTSRSVLGEPLGVAVRLRIDTSAFVKADGSFNSDVLPAYVQAYSDPEQITTDLGWAVTKHLLWWGGAGAGLGLLVCALGWSAGAWRRRRLAGLDPPGRAAVASYRAQVGAVGRRAAVAAAVLLVVAALPASARVPAPRSTITPDPILADTPLAGAQVGGLLSPALSAVTSYIQTYFSNAIAYYDRLRDKLERQLDAQPVALPTGDDVEHLLFVTDRHCNIGMDRVIVALAEHFGIKTLVSAGDDAFSGSFSFESVCTNNLAAKSQEAGMTDVFVGGNHDSPTTLAAEAQQKIDVLDGQPVTVHGLTYVGYPDPRSSRYGQGIRPASASARAADIAAVGADTGALACRSAGPVIVVLHDPTAGLDALQSGCGRAVLALTGHTHTQDGPLRVALSNGGVGYRFTGASSGGAPTEQAVEQTFASRLTVGALNHDATLNIVSVDRKTGALAGITVCHITPAQDITFEQLPPS